MILRTAIFAAAAIASLQIGALAQSGKTYRVGLISVGAPDNGILGPGMVRDFAKRGYEVDRNIVFDRRAAEGHPDRLPSLVDELVADHVDVIITQSYPAAAAAKERAGKIPIVVTNSGDPVATGLAASLAHPGGNVTGGAAQTAVLSAKRLEILKEVVPRLSREAVLWNATNPALAFAWRETQGAARALGVTLQPHEARDLKDIEAAFAAMDQERPDALLVLQDALTLQHRQEIIDFTIQKRLPGIFVAKEWVQAGGLMSYGESLPDMYHRAAHFVDRILKGAKPADLPVEQVTKFELVLNLKTAKVIGLDVPPMLLARADEVIE